MTGPIDHGNGSGPIDQPIVRQCTGHKPDGSRCRRSASHGTTVCAAHGARAPQVRAAAARRVAEGKALATFERYSPNGDAPAPVDVIAAINGLVAKVTRFEEYLAGRVAEASEQERASSAGRDRMHIELVLYRQALAESRKLLIAVGHLGLDAMQAEIDLRKDRIGQEDGAAIVGVIERTLRRLGVLSGSRRDPRIGPIVAQELMAVARGDDGPPRGDRPRGR